MKNLAILVLLVVVLAGCGGQSASLPYVERGIWGEKDSTGRFCAWIYSPMPDPSGNGPNLPFGGGIKFMPANGDFIAESTLKDKGMEFGCVKDGPILFYQEWSAYEPSSPSMYGVFDGIYGLWDERMVGYVDVRAIITDHTGPQCANGLPCGAEGGDPSRFTFSLNGRDVPITTIVEVAGFPGHMYTGAFDMFGEFYELPPGVDPATLSWRINSMGRFEWQQDTLSLPPWIEQ